MKAIFQEFSWSTESSNSVGPFGEKMEQFHTAWTGSSDPGPPRGEGALELLPLLQAVLDAKERFVMAEIGAGFGRSMVSAACALRQRRPMLPFFFVGIEAEPTHFQWMLRHFLNNGIEPSDHRLIHGAMTAQDGEAQLIVGMEGGPSEWYGQTLLRFTGFDPAALPPDYLIRVPTYSIETLLSDLNRVDFMHFDVQGAEREVIPAGIEVMTSKVKRVFVATHYNSIERRTETDEIVWKTFQGYGWISEYHFEPASEADTEFGRVQFQDGAQAWVNPKIL